jgi:hypothetical protein
MEVPLGKEVAGLSRKLRADGAHPTELAFSANSV